MNDSSDLSRFVDAQNAHGTYEQALKEIRAGDKRSHWMWFVFPQIAGLGRSSTAQHYAISGLDEAKAYLAHPVLGPRLAECVQAIPAKAPASVFGSLDTMKLHSSLTLFTRAGGGDVFTDALIRLFGGREDAGTVGLLPR